MSMTPLNIRLSDDEIVFIVNDSEASLMVVGDGYGEKVRSMRQKFKNIKTWISFDKPVDGFLDYDALLAGATEAEPDLDEYDVQEDDLAILMYTGAPPGCPRA